MGRGVGRVVYVEDDCVSGWGCVESECCGVVMVW